VHEPLNSYGSHRGAMPRIQLPVSKEGWSALSDARKPVARSAEMLTQLLVFVCRQRAASASAHSWHRVDDALLHAMSDTELSRVRTELY
jgi:hypothetical protein